jgi:class 3 adenylate cyclase
VSRDQAALEEVLPRFLERARLRGELSISRARGLVAFIVLIEEVLALFLKDLPLAHPRSWLGGLTMILGILATGLLLRSLRKSGRLSALSPLSTAMDTLLILGMALPGALWPRPDYPGQLHLSTLAFLIVAIAASGLRLRTGLVWLSISLNGGAALALALLDHQVGAAVVPVTLADWILSFGAFFGVGALSLALAHRTQQMVYEGAASVLQAERARQTLGVYVSEEVAQLALQGGAPLPGGRRQPVAVLFSDLRGFTRWSTTLPPEQLVEQLNAYLGDMVAAVRAEGGVVDKYIGDAIMVVFGVPEPMPDAAMRAFRAARRMCAALEQHNQRRASRGLPPLRHGIGLHHGEVVVGNIGTAERMQYTAVGDVVNLASRLQGASKELGVEVVISEAIVTELQSDSRTLPVLRSLGSIEIRGREDKVEVWTLP